MTIKRSVLITDVDNTLLDWVALWHATFSAMLDRLVERSGVARTQLLEEIRSVHQRHRTAEYAFLVEEVPSLRAAAGTTPTTEFYEDAIAAYGKVRREVLQLYPGVMEYLSCLRRKGVLIIAYTESLAYYTEYRFRKLGLDRVIDCLYSPADHDLPAGMTAEALRRYPESHYRMEVTEHHHTPPGAVKPNPKILMKILERVGARPEDAVYVGDSPVKDILMAQEAGVLDAHAAYGLAQHTAAYELLKAVTHWPDSTVIREAESLKEEDIKPTIVLPRRFDELMQYVDFVPFRRAAA